MFLIKMLVKMLPISLCDVTLSEDPYILPHLGIRKKNEFLLNSLFVFVSRHCEIIGDYILLIHWQLAVQSPVFISIQCV